VSQVIVLLALVFSIVIAIFAVQNTTAVDVQFLTMRAQAVAVSVLVLISAAFGAVVMLLLGSAREASMRWKQHSVSNQLRQSQARVTQLEAQAASAETPALTGTPPGDRPSTPPA
jgi:lipopolysaccharide assembly protein A